MVIEFSLGGFRSFNTIQTLSFKATSLISENKLVDVDNVVEAGEARLLKTIGVYGANGSGKSNLVRGLDAMRRIVTSSLDSETPKFILDPFLLSGPEERTGGFFQLIFLIEERRYRYGFTLDLDGEIEKEWLFGPAEKNETYYFKRAGVEVQVNPERFGEGVNLPMDKLRSDALFLSFCSSFNGALSKSIRAFFQRKIYIEGIIKRSRFSSYSTEDLVQKGFKELVINWMREVGIFLSDIEVRRLESTNSFDRNRTFFYKNRYDKDGQIIDTLPMDLEETESDGTRKFYSYIGRLFEKFGQGGLFCSDEIDYSFHPSLLQKLIRLFNNPKINKAGAQLLFTSHDTNLMDPEIMRRDQFYFTEKTAFEETRLYSLADLKGIRNNADFARQYLAGFYGALPPLSNYLENLEPEI